jgi:hypothetical protein
MTGSENHQHGLLGPVCFASPDFCPKRKMKLVQDEESSLITREVSNTTGLGRLEGTKIQGSIIIQISLVVCN